MTTRPASPATAAPATEPRPPHHRGARSWWRPLLVVVVLGVAVHVLLPQVDEVRRTLSSLGDARWWFLPPAVLFSALTFVGAAWSLQGSTSLPVRFWRTVQCQLAAAFLGRIAPANLGSLGVTGAYLRTGGAGAGETTAALGLDALGGLLVHVVLLAAAAALVGQFPHAKLALPDHFAVIVLVAAGLLVVGAVAGLWWLRRSPGLWGTLVRRLVRGVSEARAELRGVLSDPARALRLLGGSAVVTLAEIGCLEACVAAFGAQTDIVTVSFVYLAGAAVSAVSPTPGGLGAMEAALVSGLTLFGVAAGPAVTGVLLYRLLTFWLPILPGAVAVNRMRRRGLL